MDIKLVSSSLYLNIIIQKMMYYSITAIKIQFDRQIDRQTDRQTDLEGIPCCHSQRMALSKLYIYYRENLNLNAYKKKNFHA